MRRNVESAPMRLRDAHERTRDYLSEEEFAVLLQGTPRSRYDGAIRPCHAHLLSWVRVPELGRLKPRTSTSHTAHRLSVSKEPVDRATAPADELRTLKRYLTQRGNAQLPWLFLNERGDQFTRSSINYLVGITGVRAGRQFHVHPHMLRMAVATLWPTAVMICV